MTMFVEKPHEKHTVLADYIREVQEPRSIFGPIPINAAVQDKGVKVEFDPSGKSLNTPGVKGDGGKNRVGLVLGGFARALWAVAEIGTKGAAKYTPDGWITVPNGPERYDDAKMRHWLKQHMGQEYDEDSEQLHLAHDAWNALAILDLYLREKEENVKSTDSVSKRE